MDPVFVVSAKRTPIGKFGRSFSKITAPKLASEVIRSIMSQTGIDKSDIQEVIMGNVIQAGVGQNPAGQAAYLAGLPDTVIKYTVNTVCASGMLAVESAFREIALGEKDCVIAGGMENMSLSPLMLPSDFRWGPKQLLGKNYALGDAMLSDGLLDAFYHEHMGQSADYTARKLSITREMADQYAFQSFERAGKARDSGYFRNEIVPVESIESDEGIRETSMESLSLLRPSFSPDGVCTAGNSSQLSDGASALLLMSGNMMKKLGLEPLCTITGFSSASLHPRDFSEAPIPATKNLLQKQGKDISYYDIVEHNEAFAVASIAVRNGLGIDNDRFNINGGAIAIGHPLGNSGSRILVTLIHSLKRKSLKTGLATICHGGGGAHTMTVELV